MKMALEFHGVPISPWLLETWEARCAVQPKDMSPAGDDQTIELLRVEGEVVVSAGSLANFRSWGSWRLRRQRRRSRKSPSRGAR